MDESPKHLIGETKKPMPASPGQLARYDNEYRCLGMCNVFLACEPLAGKRIVNITERKTGKDWALFLEEIARQYENADKINLVMDNLRTNKSGSFYEIFLSEKARSLWERFEFFYTQKHGIWLNMVEIELNVLTSQCLKRRMDNIDFVRKEVKKWKEIREMKGSKVNWQFNTEDARIKLSRLYPTIEDRHHTSSLPDAV